MIPRRVSRALALASILFAASCAGTDSMRVDPLEKSWAADPATRLRPPATLVFEEAGERRLFLCCGGSIYCCTETGAGHVESVWQTGRPVAAIAPVGAGRGLLLVEASTSSDPTERVLWTDLENDPKVLYEVRDRLLGVPVRIGSREAWLATSSRGGDEDAVLVTADLQGRRPVSLRPADLDAVYHIARNPHTGRTLIAGVRRVGRRVESGLFDVQGDPPRATLTYEDGWCAAWSGHGKYLAMARGKRAEDAPLLRYGPLTDCTVRVTGPGETVFESPVDGVVLALCFDPADESLLFAAVAELDQVRADDLRTVRLLRLRITRDGLRSTEAVQIALSASKLE